MTHDERVRALKPLVRVRPGALLRERTGYALGARTVDELFRVADVLSEGALNEGTFFGTTLVTIDLGRALPSLDLAGDAALCARIVDAIGGSVRVRLRALRLAEEDLARRFPDRALGTARTETRFRVEGVVLHIDMDLEAPVGQSSIATSR